MAANRRNEPAPDHVCPRNYDGSSKSEGKVYVRALVTDNNASLRAVLSHPTPKGKGRLSPDIPPPEFLADPSHRTRVVARAIFALTTLNQDVSECKKIDALRFKRYFGYML